MTPEASAKALAQRDPLPESSVRHFADYENRRPGVQSTDALSLAVELGRVLDAAPARRSTFIGFDS